MTFTIYQIKDKILNGCYPSNEEVLKMASHNNQRWEILKIMAESKICKLENKESYELLENRSSNSLFTVGGDYIPAWQSVKKNVSIEVVPVGLNLKSTEFSCLVAMHFKDEIAKAAKDEEDRKIAREKAF